MSFMLWAVGLVVVLISIFWYRWSNPNCNGKLPPGSMGFPIIGETVGFFKARHGLYEISPFVKTRMLRHGPLFRTNLFGSNTVVSTDMNVNLNILREENKSFVASYDDSFGKLLGENSLFVQRGEIHKYIKKITLGFLGPEGMKRMILGDLDRMTQEYFRSKANQDSFEVDHSIKDLIVTYWTPKIISNLKPENKTKLIDDIKAFNLDFTRPRLDISTLKDVFMAFKGSRGATQMINDVCKQRKASREKYTDFLDILLQDLEKDGSLFTQESVENLTLLILFGATETIPKVLTLALKFIYENPKVLEELKREHAAILESREDKESGISWEEYRNKMTFTSMVINEVLRLGNGVPVIFRKTVKDVEIKGYTIPAGWSVVVVPTVVHLDPEVYENPLEFNPWRWEGKDTRSGSKTFMAFGGGMRQCVGAEFARLQIAVYLHHLVTKYDFVVVQDFKVLRGAGLFIDKDMRIRLISSHTHKNG